jgi:hypothetical protein
MGVFDDTNVQEQEFDDTSDIVNWVGAFSYTELGKVDKMFRLEFYIDWKNTNSNKKDNDRNDAVIVEVPYQMIHTYFKGWWDMNTIIPFQKNPICGVMLAYIIESLNMAIHDGHKNGYIGNNSYVIDESREGLDTFMWNMSNIIETINDLRQFDKNVRMYRRI